MDVHLSSKVDVYLYEPRANRVSRLSRDLRANSVNPIEVTLAYIRGNLEQLGKSGKETRALLLAADGETPAVIRKLRHEGFDNVIVVMRDGPDSQMATDCLNAGADDDIVVPDQLAELQARINCVLRRRFGHSAESVTVGQVKAYFDGRDPEVAGQRVRLSRREYAIFRYLALNANKVISKSAIYDAIYGMEEDQPFDKVIDVYICKIRKKIDAVAPDGDSHIETVHGRGYKFSPAGAA